MCAAHSDCQAQAGSFDVVMTGQPARDNTAAAPRRARSGGRLVLQCTLPVGDAG